MIKKLFSALGVFILVLVIYAAVTPAEYLIKREIIITTKPEAITPYLVSMKRADEWMPWKETDPQVKNSYSGAEEGVGSVSSWESPGKMGVGQAEVVEVIPNQKVTTKITYTKPMAFTQDSEFILTPEGENTKMAWTVKGQNPFLARLMCLITFMDMDKYVGGQFELGLKKLKDLAEKK